MDAKTLFETGWAHQQAQRLDDARRTYEQVLALQPDYFDAANLLATVLVQQGQYETALAAFDRALRIRDDFPVTYHNRGICLEFLQRNDEAVQAYTRTIELFPDYAAAYLARANMLLDHHTTQALLDYEQCIRCDPNNALAWERKGVALGYLKRFSEAVAAYTQAIMLNPNGVTAYNNRAVAYIELGQQEEGLKDYGRAIELLPTMASLYNNRGNLYRMRKEYPSAIADFDATLRLSAYFQSALTMASHCRALAADWTELPEQIERLRAQIKAHQVVTVPFPLLALMDDPAALLQSAQIYAQFKHAPRAPLWQPPQRIWRHEGRIRIAYLSADFYNHATAFLMADLFEQHDRSRFEVFAYSFGPPQKDSMRQRVESSFEHFYDVSGWSDEQVARHIHAQRIPIVIDLKGYTGDSRTGIFAWRPAPIAVNYIGYPGTMGVPYMDYIIADPVLIPPPLSVYYSEKIVRMPDSYQPNDRLRQVDPVTPTRAQLGLPSDGFVFCCFNNNYKILPQIFDIWMRLLHAVPKSVLWLLKDNPEVERNFRAHAQERGIAPERLIFAERALLPQHLARQKQADLFLDTLPYNAHTTASDALWVGLPVLTCMGQSFAARVAASLLTAAGLPELITENLAAYEQRALQLAQQPDELRALRERLEANRHTCALFDTPRYVRHLETAYERMMVRAEQGLPPADIDL